MFKIEKNVPSPNRMKHDNIALAKEMEVGDSVVVPTNQAGSLGRTIKNDGFRYETSKIKDTETTRVWKLSVVE